MILEEDVPATSATAAMDAAAVTDLQSVTFTNITRDQGM
jgi:hypothetical protein